MAGQGAQAMTDARQSPFERWTDRDLVDLIEAYPLAWVVSRGAPLLSTPLPMLVEADDAGRPVSLLGHFARRNPQIEQIRAEPQTLFLFTGPNAYLSPELVKSTRDWAPTWNYAVARVTAEVRFDDALNDEALKALVDKMEKGRPRPWSVAELGSRYEQLKRHIIAFRAPIVAVEAKFKLGQDEPSAILSQIMDGIGDVEVGRWMHRCNIGRP